MALDFTEYFKKYEELVAEVDNLFARFEKDFPDKVKCEKGCCDCCYALFDLSLVESLYINHHFTKAFSGMGRTGIMDASDKYDRQVFKLKRKLFKSSQKGLTPQEVMEEVARTRIRCPLLGEGDLCVMYDKRPLTCRLYGVPTAIAGQGHTCAKSGFVAGEKYPTVQMDALHDRLLAISQEIADSISTRYAQLGDMLMPVSTALMTEFSDSFLGVRTGTPKQAPQAEQPESVAPAPSAPASEACASCTEDKSKCQTCSENSFSVVLGGKGDGKE